MAFKYSKMFTQRTNEQKLALTQSELDEIKADCEKLDKENDAEYQTAATKNNELVKELKQIHSGNSLLVKYLEKNAVVKKNWFKNIGSYENLIRDIKNLKEEQERAKMVAKVEHARKDQVQRAVIFLNNKSLKLGEDFNLDDAVAQANNIRFEELKAEAIANGGVDDFNGMNCDTDCGWDGVSHQCNCGNRRVDWSWDGDFDNMYIYGEAY